MFTTLLIANRGEIACRVATTARKMGIRTVAVFSDADANSKHIALCDVAVRIGAAPARDSYLKAEVILQVAIEQGAQAIHPGYGFLSENSAFAEACAQAGVIFVGPPAGAIAAMGSKSAAKTLMAEAGVPLVPGYHGDNQDPVFLHQQADLIGYPVLIKASAGGGGKGMRVVSHSKEFDEALISCKREALSSFSDEHVLLERYLQKPRHIEIQVFADQHGHYVYLFERDCSVQRRHQKVIEEAPAPGMTPERRRAMGEAAIAAARAVNYVGAGTVEFIVEPDGRFYFMEMNTRLQVEHPVTEMITGLDLVEWQLRVAAGETLPCSQEQLQYAGHAIEARLYAENPDTGFLPSVGTLSYLSFPAHCAFANADIRVDGGVRTGDVISPFYDPMIAKVIVRGADRDEARARMLQVLAHTHVVGVHTNVAFLSRLMLDAAFAASDLDTGLIERQRATLLPPVPAARKEALALATAAILLTEQGTQDHDPWSLVDGWRMSGTYQRELTWMDGEHARVVRMHQHTLQGEEPRRQLEIDGVFHVVSWRALPDEQAGSLRMEVMLDTVLVTGLVVRRDERVQVFVSGCSTALVLRDALAHAADQELEHAGGLTAPMPGKIIAINVEAGARVKRGQALLVMEAMKMEHTIHAPVDGVVEEIFFIVGDQVADGSVLVSLDEACEIK